MINYYRNTLITKSKEQARLTDEKARLMAKSSQLSGKINTANDYIRRTKSPASITSKIREIDRYDKELVTTTKKIADIEKKIAAKGKEILDYQSKIDKEQQAIDRKRNAEAQKTLKDQQKNLQGIQSALREHDRLHWSAQLQIDDLKKLPERIIVLLLASNPVDEPALRLDEEARSITEMIRKARHRDSVKLESCWAVRPADLLQALNEHKPAVVHFSGHGSDDDEIILQDDSGYAKPVSKEAMVQTMMVLCDGIKLVFFNTCYSRNQAEAVSKFVDATIGMNTEIGDDAARIFSSQFYSAISFGTSVGHAFRQAKARLMLEGIQEENTPELFVKEGLSADEIYLVSEPGKIN